MFYYRGKRVSRVKLRSHISCRGGFDSQLAHRLRAWSLTKFAREVKEDPRQILRALGSEDGTEQIGSSHAASEEDVVLHEMSESSPALFLLPMLDQLSSITMYNEDHQYGLAMEGGELHPSLLYEYIRNILYGDCSEGRRKYLKDIAACPAGSNDQQWVANKPCGAPGRRDMKTESRRGNLY